MTENLTPEALQAIWAYVAAAGEHDANPRFGQDARLNLLLSELLIAGGTWADVEALINLGDPALEFLDQYAGRTVWLVLGGTLPVFDEQPAQEAA